MTKTPKEVRTGDALASFIFDLLRDHVPFGKVEMILETMEDLGPNHVVFTDPNLGKYCIDLANRIRALDVKE